MKASAQAMALLLAGSMALAACASDEPTSGSGGQGGGGTTTEDLRVGLAYDTGGRGDRSFNDSAYTGASAAVDALGGKLQELSPNDDASNRAELLTQLAEQGFNPVIAVGFNYDDVIAEVAPQFPDTTFAQVDGSNADGAKGGNVTGLRRGGGLVPRRRRGGPEERGRPHRLRRRRAEPADREVRGRLRGRRPGREPADHHRPAVHLPGR
jgi:basic membrane protein A